MTRPRTSRRPWQASAAILLGLATTIAATWALAFWGRVTPGPFLPSHTLTSQGSAWNIKTDHATGIRRAWAQRLSPAFETPIDTISNTLPPGSRLDARLNHRAQWMTTHSLTAAGSGTSYLWVDEASGWPFPAAASETRFHSAFLAGPQATDTRWGIPLTSLPPGPGDRLRALPLRPILPGLAANILFWSGLWFAAITGPGALRRRRRASRGQCLSCGYDLAGTSGAVCPECGAQT